MIRVGAAMISDSVARPGSWSDIDNFKTYRPFRLASQISHKFLIASLDRGVVPLVNRRRHVVPRPYEFLRASRGSRMSADDFGHDIIQAGIKIKAEKNFFGHREIANDAPDRCREFSDERRDCENLVGLGELRITHQIDHLDRAVGRAYGRRRDGADWRWRRSIGSIARRCRVSSPRLHRLRYNLLRKPWFGRSILADLLFCRGGFLFHLNDPFYTDTFVISSWAFQAAVY